MQYKNLLEETIKAINSLQEIGHLSLKESDFRINTLFGKERTLRITITFKDNEELDIIDKECILEDCKGVHSTKDDFYKVVYLEFLKYLINE